jgi:hypothetical protein
LEDDKLGAELGAIREVLNVLKKSKVYLWKNTNFLEFE